MRSFGIVDLPNYTLLSFQYIAAVSFSFPTMLRLLLICLVLSLAYNPVFAQRKKGQAFLDSLLAELLRTKPDTNRAKLLYTISNSSRINPNEGINYANQSLVLARRLTWKKGMAFAYTILGGNYERKSDYPKALASHLSGLKIAEEIKDKDLIAGVTGNVGGIYEDLANYPQALAYYEKALKGHHELGDKVAEVNWLNDIGGIYNLQGEYVKALDYHQKSLKLNEAMGFRGRAKESNFDNVGQSYLNLADYSKAFDYLQNGLNLSQANKNKGILVSSYHNLGKLYLKIATDSNATSLTTLLRSNKTSTLQKAGAYADSAIVLAKNRAIYPIYIEPIKPRVRFRTRWAIHRQLWRVIKSSSKQKTWLSTSRTPTKLRQLLFSTSSTKKKRLSNSKQQLSAVQLQQQKQQRTYLLAGFGLLATLLGFIVYGYAQKQKANTVLQRQKEEINQKSTQLEQSLIELRATQTQLIQKEKMASLGELTAGIAHEIQNPLNFVTNFSEVSAELVTELEEEQQKPDRDTDLEADLLGDLKQNLQKISHHGGRASAIVKGMLEHSRTGTGEKRPTNLNALAEEYLKIAYHGLRAKDKTDSADRFNAELKTNFGTDLGLVEVVPQEIGRVLLNLYNNAFYALSERATTAPPDFQPTVTVSTTQLNGHVEIRVSDNGTGMPDAVKAKIFQPFFTTKPTGEGTGLGLSLSYDIVTKGHGGSLMVESQQGQGTTFIILLAG